MYGPPRFIGPKGDMRRAFETQMCAPHFPVGLDTIRAQLAFRAVPHVSTGTRLAVGDLLQRFEVDREALLAWVLQQIVSAVGADRSTLYLVNARRGELYAEASHLPELPETRLRIGQGLLEAEKGHFSPDDQARVRVLCAEAATAIGSPSLYEKLTGKPGDVAPLKERCRYNREVGESAPMRAVYQRVRSAAARSASVSLHDGADDAHRERAVRPREARVQRCRHAQHGSLRARARRRAVHRRGR